MLALFFSNTYSVDLKEMMEYMVESVLLTFPKKSHDTI